MKWVYDYQQMVYRAHTDGGTYVISPDIGAWRIVYIEPACPTRIVDYSSTLVRAKEIAEQDDAEKGGAK